MNILLDLFGDNTAHVYLVLKHLKLPSCIVKFIVTKFMKIEVQNILLCNLFDFNNCARVVSAKEYYIYLNNYIFEVIHVENSFLTLNQCGKSVIKNHPHKKTLIYYIANYLNISVLNFKIFPENQDFIKIRIAIPPYYIQKKINEFCNDFGFKKLHEIIALKKSIIKHKAAVKSVEKKISMYF